jgi:hypothetical protein
MAFLKFAVRKEMVWLFGFFAVLKKSLERPIWIAPCKFWVTIVTEK